MTQQKKQDQPPPQFEDVVRRMLSTPPTPHKPKVKKQAKKRQK